MPPLVTLLLLAAATASAQAPGTPAPKPPVQTEWDKVRALKTGVELRIFKAGATQDEAREDVIVVILKNEQVAIQKADIDRLDYRPQGGTRLTRQTTVTKDAQVPGAEPKSPTFPTHPESGNTSSATTNYSVGDKPAFETLYRRKAASSPPQK
ncbi:MAG: hypothetical protein HZB13_06100 [Acidobacteria bacterium]|nr:hypothetical protein [Acidobacteriota bacterium]